MDEALCAVTTDLSKRPYLVYNLPGQGACAGDAFIALAKEFFRAFSTRGGMNLHINVDYGENAHHIIESVFKAAGRSLDMAAQRDPRITGVLSTKGSL
jgi:imidazoleglycerol-phosphate dehydratase